VATLLVLALLTAPGSASAASYYVGPSGDDGAPGTSPAGAWRTLAEASARSFGPGDAILLEAGTTHHGSLVFGDDDRGTAAAPVTVGAYGSGRAVIQAAENPGIVVYNTSGIVLRDLEVKGPGVTTSATNGITVYTDLPGDVLLPGITIERVEVSGFGRSGLSIGGWNGRSGFRDVALRQVHAHDNRRAGISTYAQVRATHRDVVVHDSEAEHNPGEPGLPGNSGNGIVLGGVDGGRVDSSLAHHNGGHDTAAEGPVGIWAYDSNAVVLERNESWANRTGGAADGGGFDLDQATSNSVAQFNYSHDNDGAGFLLANGPGTADHTGNTVRYNVSENDGRDNGQGGILLWRRSSNLQVHHNTVFLSPTAEGSAALRIYDVPAPEGGAAGAFIRNNLWVTTGGARLVRMTKSAPSALRIEGNGYHASGSRLEIVWDGRRHGSLEAWRAASGQESVGGTTVGLAADPRLTAAGRGGTIGDARRLGALSAYRLRPGSPAIDAGLDLRAALGAPPASTDFYGAPVRVGGRTMGAAEAPAATGPAPSTSATVPTPASPAGLASRRSHLVLRPRCRAACTVRATLSLEPRLSRRLRLRAVVARGVLRMRRGGRGRLELRVAPHPARVLRGLSRVRLVLRTEVRPRSAPVRRTARRVTLGPL
jgi:hypothetical protein